MKIIIIVLKGIIGLYTLPPMLNHLKNKLVIKEKLKIPKNKKKINFLFILFISKLLILVSF